MKISNLLDTIGVVISLIVIIIASLYSHYFIGLSYLYTTVGAIIIFNLIKTVASPSQRIVAIMLCILGGFLTILLIYKHLNSTFTLAYIAFVITSLSGLKYLFKRFNKEFQVISNVSTITQILALIFIPFYMTLGFKMINAIKQSPTLTGIKHRLINLQEEASITNPKAIKYYQEAKELSIQGKDAEAFEKLSNAMYREPDNAYLHSQMSRQYLFRSDTIMALDHINKALNYSSGNIYYLQQRSFLKYKLQLFTDAQSDAHQLKAQDKRNAWAQLLLAYLSYERKDYDKACEHADSASMFCSHYLLQQDINRFISDNCGNNRYFNLIKPYESDILSPDVGYYYKQYMTDDTGEPLIEKGIPPKGNFTRQEIKQHIIRNHKFFIDQNIDFIYLYENETNVLIAIRRDGCHLSKTTLKYIFVEPGIFPNFELRVI
jgi:hypothetical protein